MDKGNTNTMEIIQPILAITGHRKLSHDEAELRILVRNHLHSTKPAKVLIGMALGFDMLVAEECKDLGIPFVACVPFEGQEKFWLPGQKNKYHNLLEAAESVEILFSEGFASWKFLKRNEHMVKHSTHLLAYWDGAFRSGTGHTVRQGQTKGIPMVNLYKEKPVLSSSREVPEDD
jgi:hypothetical protein